jgi:hypothetical protein
MRIEGPFVGETVVLFCDLPVTVSIASDALASLGVTPRIHLSAATVPVEWPAHGGLERASRSGELPIVVVRDQPADSELAELMRRGAAAVVVLADSRDARAIFARTIEVLRAGFGPAYLPAQNRKVA